MTRNESIAIVGMGGVFPQAPTLDAFCANILAGRDASREVPPGRWILDPADVYDPEPKPDKTYSTRGCFVEDFAFDADGLAIDPELAAQLDPVYQFALHAGRQAYRSAKMESINRDRIGVTLAAIALPTDASSAISREILGKSFEKRLLAGNANATSVIEGATHPLNSRVVGMPGGLLANALGLGGGGYTLDAACASSLYAIKLACEELTAHRTDAMLAGGVSRPECLYTQIGFSQLRALSPSGVCRPFDAGADGLVVGEGAGVVVLKRLSDALRDGDEIHGIIRGIGLSNDIAGSLLAADSEGQVRAMRQAYEQAGWSPEDVDHIECHGTGTPLGDGVEVKSMKTLWRDADWRKGQCAIGSVKSMVGHLLTGAGAAGLVKTLLAMREQTLPPSANFQTEARGLELANSPFRVQTKAQPWTRREADTPRRAAISAFGFGGINAHLLIEEWMPQAPTHLPHRDKNIPVPVITATNDARTPIAIVGMATRFGDCDSTRRFQETYFTGNSVLCNSPSDERWFGVSNPDLPGTYVEKVEIPIGKFRLPPNEIPETLPQQLLMLQSVADALADAGVTKRENDPRTGLTVGLGLDLNTSNYHLRWALLPQARAWAKALGLELDEDALREWVETLREESGPALNATRVLGSLGGIVASRIAREFAFGGPCFTVSSEEASGMRALEIGVRALQRSELDTAVVGAVDLAGDIRHVLTAATFKPFSKEGEVRPFDASADGTLPGEGAVTFVLKRLDDARANGDRIYAVVRGMGFAGGGAIGAANAEVYERALWRAYEDAAVNPATVSLIEAHGSGVPEEDCAESAALRGFFAKSGPSDRALSSVKSTIGSCGAVAGLASVAGAALALYQEIIPGSIRCDEAEDAAQWDEGGWYVPVGAEPWLRDRADGPRRAGVSAMALDGNCAHVVLEGVDDASNARATERLRPVGAMNVGVFAIGGANVAQLLTELDALENFVQSGSARPEKLASSWWRSAPLARDAKLAVAVCASGTDELRKAIQAARQHLRESSGESLKGRDGVFYSPEPLGRTGEIAFVFPGSGNHFLGMGREIGTHWPEVLRRIDAETLHLKSQIMPRWFFPWTTGRDEGRLRDAAQRLASETARLIMGQVAFGATMTDLLRLLGIEPAAAIGYSLGETTSLFALRVWRDRDEMLRRMQTSPLFRSDLAGRCDAARKAWRLDPTEDVDWCVAVVNRPADEVRQAVLRSRHAYVLIANAPDECVIGGQRGDVEDVIITLGCEAVELEGASTVHCAIAREVESAYRELHLLDTTPPAGIRFYSAAQGQSYNVTRESAARSILEQALNGFNFPAVIERAYADGVRLFVEVGPQASCTRMIGKILAGKPHFARSASLANQSETTSVLQLVAALVAERVSLDLTQLYADETLATAHICEREDDTTKRCITVPTGGPPPNPRLPQQMIGGRTATVRASAVAPLSGERSTIDLPAEVARTQTQTALAHESFLRFSNTAATGLSHALALQTRLLETEHGNLATLRPAAATAPAYPREMCMEFAVGSVANVLGPEFAEADTYRARVRLPDEPLMLVDRILTVTGKKGSLTGGTIVTEHDVLRDGWYLDGGRMPISITVEAGQADLFLCSYLGIDLAVKGERVYRLLDATVQFHRGLPKPGEVVRYDIRIDRFVRQGDTYLFFFAFEGSIAGQPLLSMSNGCAGFFTDEEIRKSGGIVETHEERHPKPRTLPADWRDLAPLATESYDEQQVDALRQGNLFACFGSAFAQLPLTDPVRLPGGRMRLVHRVTQLDPTGGRYSLGLIRAEADIHPNDWFLTCHFVDDMVMPGTLMYECCAHTLRIYLMRMGWLAEAADVCYEPIEGVCSALRCRGPVTAATKIVTYEVHLKEIGYNPEPYAIADALMYADGECIVRFVDMSLKMTGVTRQQVEAIWCNAECRMQNAELAARTKEPSRDRKGADATKGISNLSAHASNDSAIHPIGDTPLPNGPKQPLYDTGRILAFATGNPSEAFGQPYKPFDADRRIARLPGPPYQVLDRITETQAQAWLLEPEGWIEAQYDVSPDAWYFRANRQRSMPFAVLLEIALQPCGWLAAYKGSALRSATDMSFRNLGGTATQYEEVFADCGTLTTRVRLTNVSEAGGMIIETFDMQVWRDGRIVYAGETTFGFFAAEALAQQVGIRDAKQRQYVPTNEELARGTHIAFPHEAPLSPDDPRTDPATAMAMPATAWRMIDEIESFVPDGGPHGLGFLRGIKQVDPTEWFFAAHFYQDPVCPGSLGLESFLQLLKHAALHRWGEKYAASHRFTPIIIGAPHTWAYRGQIVPSNKKVTVEAVIKEIRESPVPTIIAHGFLSVDGKAIYELKDFGLSLMPA